MFKIKQSPKDFIVKEIGKFKLTNQGHHLILKLTKINRNTFDVIKEIARQLKINIKKIGFAGMKDKFAITEQFISIESISESKINNLKIDNCSFEIIGKSKDPISLGDLEANQFEIIVHTTDSIPQTKDNFFTENYFDEQRFSKYNVQIGKLIITRQFDKAYKLICKSKSQTPITTKDYIKEIRKIPKRELTFYIHSYQSYIFNQTASKYIQLQDPNAKTVNYSQGIYSFSQKQIQNTQIPIIGFSSYKVSEQLNQIIKDILNQEKITQKDFIIKSLPNLSSEGCYRDLLAQVKNFSFESIDQNTIKLNFQLPPGSYATIVIKKLFS